MKRLTDKELYELQAEANNDSGNFGFKRYHMIEVELQLRILDKMRENQKAETPVVTDRFSSLDHEGE